MDSKFHTVRRGTKVCGGLQFIAGLVRADKETTHRSYIRGNPAPSLNHEAILNVKFTTLSLVKEFD